MAVVMMMAIVMVMKKVMKKTATVGEPLGLSQCG